MQSPYIGRGIALVVIVGLVCWTAFRALGSRPAEAPKMPLPVAAIDAPLATAKSQQTVVLAGGCFWGVQAVFEHLKGVSSVTSGYSGDFVKNNPDNPYIVYNDLPKLENLKKDFPNIYQP